MPGNFCFRSIPQALKPGGRLVVVDFRPVLLRRPWMLKGVPTNRGGQSIPPRIFEDELTKSGSRTERFYEH